MYKIIIKPEISSLYFDKKDPILEKAANVKMHIEEDSCLNSTREALKQGSFTDEEMYGIAMAAMKRRRINYVYRGPVAIETVSRLLYGRRPEISAAVKSKETPIVKAAK
jgi:hypothetical protein